jgi:hypothetical protein
MNFFTFHYTHKCHPSSGDSFVNQKSRGGGNFSLAEVCFVMSHKGPKLRAFFHVKISSFLCVEYSMKHDVSGKNGTAW